MSVVTGSTSTRLGKRRNFDYHHRMLSQILHNNCLQKSCPSSPPTGSAVLQDFDDSLTNLNWLQKMRPMPFSESSTASIMAPPVKVMQYKESSPLPPIGAAVSPTAQQQQQQQVEFSLLTLKERQEYQNNSHLKPPFSYANLISMALMELRLPKATLSEIYRWITQNFMYYQVCDSSWQNSIRHNLSLNKCFEKIPRNRNEPGKGGYWRISPAYYPSLQATFTKRIQSIQEDRRDNEPALMPELSTTEANYRHNQHQQQLHHHWKVEENNSPPISMVPQARWSENNIGLRTDDDDDGDGRYDGLAPCAKRFCKQSSQCSYLVEEQEEEEEYMQTSMKSEALLAREMEEEENDDLFLAGSLEDTLLTPEDFSLSPSYTGDFKNSLQLDFDLRHTQLDELLLSTCDFSHNSCALEDIVPLNIISCTFPCTDPFYDIDDMLGF